MSPGLITPTCAFFMAPVVSFAAPADGRPMVRVAAAPPAVCRKSRRSCFTVSSLAMAADLLHVDDLDPVRAVAHRVAARFAKFARALVDLIDREGIGFFSRGYQIFAGRIDPYAAL